MITIEANPYVWPYDGDIRPGTDGDDDPPR